MLLLSVALAAAMSRSDDFAIDAGAWSGGAVQDGVLRVADGRVEFTGFDPAQVASFSISARLRSTDAASWSLAAGSTPLTVRHTEPSGVLFGDSRWPLPMGHLRWAPDADPAFEAGADAWEAGGVLHAAVVHDEAAGQWRLYYTAFYAPPGYGYRQIGVATSPDGRTWTRFAGNPVLTIDYSADVDGVHVHMPEVVRAPDGTWQMYYSCYQNNVGNRICRAESADGLVWTPQGVALDRGAPGEFDAGSLRMPGVWIDAAGVWHLWYDGTDPEQHYGPTGYATSTDGVSWVKHGAILDADHALQGLDVVETPWGLEAFYNHDDYFVRASADPADPATWTEAGVILTKGWSPWNDGYIQAPTLALDGTTWRMWFNGYTYTDGMERLGHATGLAEPGVWMTVSLSWDGAQLRATVDGAELDPVAQEGLDALALQVQGTAELDDVTVSWEPLPTDTGDTGDSGDGGDTGEPSDTADTASGEDTSPADTATAPTPDCGCAGVPGAPAAALALAAAWGLRWRRSRRAADE